MIKRKNVFILLITIACLLLMITLILKFKTTRDNTLQIEQTPAKSSNAGTVVANLKASTSYNQSYAKYNTSELQSTIDEVSNNGGGTVHIPSGTYYFESAGMNARKVEDYVIMCKNNVTVEGDGSSSTTGTILKPYGETTRGLDMFYFNDYADSGFTTANYLVNADFKDFVIDSSQTSTETYTTAGKGFMINLFKDCDWENVKVKNTDGTGFGMDCPINSTIKNCEAVGCGKAATTSNAGASGFGIGTGYSNNEYIHIIDCIATNNKKYGFFFEHQGRFSESYYTATKSQGFVVSNCTASGNLYDLGGNRANDVTYENCTSNGTVNFENYSRRIHLINIETNASFTDVTDTSSYYYTPVYWSVNKGISNGTSETTFKPDTLCSRGQAITFLWRMSERQGEVVYGRTPQISTGFSDVTSDSSYADAVKWGVDEGIVTGTSTGTFSPDNDCTRADFITFLWRCAGSPVVSTTNNFTDVETGSYYEKAVNWAVNKGIINGTGGTAFTPNSGCKRADIVTMIYRYMNGNNEFNITYNLNGGTVSGNPTSYESGSDTFTLKNPTKQGYIFTGWTGSNGTTPQKTVTIPKGTIGNLEFTANWEVIEEDNPQNLEVQLTYSTLKLTNKNVKVVISANNKIKAVEGWTLSSDEKSISKEYEENTIEEITIVDEYSNQITKLIQINNIDKNPPQVTIEYNQEENGVLVIINSNEEIQEINGWTLSDDKKIAKI